jgi:hypothetical protein
MKLEHAFGVIALCACSSAQSKTPRLASLPEADAGMPSVRALYKLGATPMAFLDIPWPDDGYLDANGHVAVRDLPSRAPREFSRALAESLGDLDGFGLRPAIYFRFDGALDSASLPRDAQSTLDARSSVFLVDADTSSPDAFKRVPVDVSYEKDTFELRLRPASWRALYPGRRYAAVVTSSVTAADGSAVEGAERFLRIRDPETALADPGERAARALYAPVLQTLASRGVPRERIAALAVFHVQSARLDLVGLHDLVRKPPLNESMPSETRVPVFTDALSDARLDEVLGMGGIGLDMGGPHDHIGWMVHGSFGSPNLLAATDGVHGAFEATASGELRVKAQSHVPFTLWLPRGNVVSAAWPVVIFQHGLGGDRSDGLPLANALAASGYAVIAIDAPFHGSRSGAGDQTNRFTGAATPDGFGDAPGDFIGEQDDGGELLPLHPYDYRDAVRQGVVDLVALAYVLQEGDWSGLGRLNKALAGLQLNTGRLSFVGSDLGGEMGVMLASIEPNVAGVVLACSGGLTIDAWIDSPGVQPRVDALLMRLGRERGELDHGSDSALLWPDLDAWRTLSDRASALAQAPVVRSTQVNVLMLMARDDEVVHNRSSESLALALGAQLVGGQPQAVPDLSTADIRQGATLSANYPPGSGTVTRVLYLLDPSTHELLTLERGTQSYDHPAGGLSAPFSPLVPPRVVNNPIAATLTQIAFFFESLRACSATGAGTGAKSMCAASVQAQ